MRPSPALERSHPFLGTLVKIGLAPTGDTLWGTFVDVPRLPLRSDSRRSAGRSLLGGYCGHADFRFGLGSDFPIAKFALKNWPASETNGSKLLGVKLSSKSASIHHWG